jgi:hypothetical protein
MSDRFRSVRQGLGLRIAESRQQLAASIRLTRGTLIATRKLLVGVGLIEEKKREKKARYIPFDLFWVVWWAIFFVGLILPTYSPEPFVVFPSVLALAVVWLFGMAQFTQTLLGTDLRDVRLTPGAWTVLLRSYQEAGIQFPDQAMTAESAEAAAKEVEGWLPGVARQSVLDWTSLAAVQAVAAGCVAIVGLLVGPSLSNVHWWHGWSPVSVLYGASLPTGLSLLLFGLVPFVVSRFLAALRVRSEAGTEVPSPSGAQTANPVTDAATAPAPAREQPKPRRRLTRHSTPKQGEHA